MWLHCTPYCACSSSICLKFLAIYLHVILLIFGEFHENRPREGRTSLKAASEIQFTCLPLNGIMTFWNYGTPEYNLRTASNLQPCCKYRSGNTTKPHRNFRIKRFTVESGFSFVAGSNSQFGGAVLLRAEGWSHNCGRLGNCP